MVFSTTDVKKTFQKKGPSKSVHRVKALEKYSTELIQGDPSVTQSSEVLQFFQPKAHDLEPDFGKNRYGVFEINQMHSKSPLKSTLVLRGLNKASE